MTRQIGRAATLSIFIWIAAVQGAAQDNNTRRTPAQRKADPTTQSKTVTQSKVRETQPGVSAQGTADCSGRPGARCAKKGGAKKLRTIF